MRGEGPDIAGAGTGAGTVLTFTGNTIGSGGATTVARYEFDTPPADF